ncbi:MAG: methyltransferase domain-containing protein [Acidobacteriia bacterium]|nr:methyltransferase domain-containing protein [Terriglobia bacterium]
MPAIGPQIRDRAALEQLWVAERQVEDDWSKVYDETYDELQPAYRLYKHKVACLVEAYWRRTGGRILDVGCGTGAVLRILAQRGVPQSYLTGLDISPEMVDLSRKKLPEAGFAASPIELFTTTASYGVIYFCGSLHHMPDLKLVIAKLAELLQPGGVVVVCEPNEDWMFQNLWWNRAVRLAIPMWFYWRWRNRVRINRIRSLTGALSEPPHHVHIRASDLAALFGVGFKSELLQTDFPITRLFEGVVTEDGRTLRWLRGLDRLCGRWFPMRGGSLESVYIRL